MVRKPYITPAVVYETSLEVRAGSPATYDNSPSKTIYDRRASDDKDASEAARWDAQDARAAEAAQRAANRDGERSWWGG